MSKILDRVALYLREGGTEPVELAEGASAGIAGALAELFGTTALVDAVEELALFGCWLIQDKGAPAAGRALLGFAHDTIPELEALGDAARKLADDLRSAAAHQDYSRFTGREKTGAPSIGEPVPEGSEKARGALSRFTLGAKLKKPSDPT